MTAARLSPPPFRLAHDFVESYRNVKPPFGFNGLGELVYLRTYSRLKEDGTNEQWFETVKRVVEGTYSMQRRWIAANGLHWNQRKAQRSAQEMYERMFHMKFLPPGRGLWAMGSPLTEERELWAALNNCAFVSTENLHEDLAEPFTFLMDASMLGIGVGFDTMGAGKVKVRDLIDKASSQVYVIPDTREGWVESVRLLLAAFMDDDTIPPVFDYSHIREAGLPIKGFGGVSAGPEPLRQLHQRIETLLNIRVGQHMSSSDIVDIMNYIGACVVAGNVRRTAEIAFGSHDDKDFLDLKNGNVNPARMHQETGWGHVSNNSVFAELGMDYREIAKRIAVNGEPGLAWLQNMRAFSRMTDAPDLKDHRVKGGNPCLEQSLESYELCCLVETFPNNHDSLEDYQKTLKFAYLYAKTVTLGRTPWERTNAVLLKNRRIGVSMSGIVQAIMKVGINEFQRWCLDGYAAVEHYDQVYSDWFAIPRSIKMTSVKPSGTVSLLAGATPGVHYPEFTTYIRRMRVGRYSDLLKPLKRAGYPIEPSSNDPENTFVVEFPVKLEGIRTADQVSLWEQLALAAFMQCHWADNQVSCTVTFDPERESGQIAPALEYYQYQLKGISFLPRFPKGAYAQMPYEAITEEEYERRIRKLKPVVFGETHEEVEVERFCNNDTCVLL